MDTGKHSTKRIHLFYRGEDAFLYFGALVTVFAATWFALPMATARILAGIALALLAVTFVLKHGARLDRTAIGALGRGLAALPRVVGATVRTEIPIIVAFGIAVAVESIVRAMAPTSILLAPLPYLEIVLVPFAVISAYRTIILGAHLRQAPRIGAILASSGWRHQLEGMGIRMHILQAYLTGLVAHACLLLPALLVWRWTDPTWLRELVLLGAGALFYVPIARMVRTVRRSDGTHSLVSDIVMVHDMALTRMLRSEHGKDHRSRLRFAAVHGQHHDAIPSALIGGPGVGFLEAMWIGGTLGLQSSVISQPVWALSIVLDIQAHSYLPGVFPYVRRTIESQVHHVAHHYGSLLPLALSGIYNGDTAAGYNPGCARAQWFVDLAQRSENVDAAACQRFLSLHANARYARASELLQVEL